MGILKSLKKIFSNGSEDPRQANYSSEVERWLSPEWQQGQGAVRAGLPQLQALLSGGKLAGGEDYLKGAERNYETARNRMRAQQIASGSSGFGGTSGVDQSYQGNSELARGEGLSRAGLDYQQAMSDRLQGLLLPLMNQQNQLYNTALGKTVIHRKGKKNLLKSLQGIGEGIAGFYSGNYGMMGQGINDFAGGLQRQDIVEGAGGGGGGGGWDSGGAGGGDWQGLGNMVDAFRSKKTPQQKAYGRLPQATQQYGVGW